MQKRKRGRKWALLCLAAAAVVCYTRYTRPATPAATVAESAPPLTVTTSAAPQDAIESPPLFGRRDPVQETPAYVPEIRNDTAFAVDPAVWQMSNVSLDVTDAPQVLIVHTHTSEAYTPDDAHPYVPDDNDRTLDERYNVVAVGERVGEVLETAGIAVLHDTTLNDYPSYSGSYSRMCDIIEGYLVEYPTIRVVLDVHRDAIIYDDGTRFAPTSTIGGARTAQVMLVVGTNEGGLTHDAWAENLAFALDIQRTADETYPGLMRPVNLRSARFNQHVSPGALIVEIGASGNTLGEALNGASRFAEVLVETLYGDVKSTVADD